MGRLRVGRIPWVRLAGSALLVVLCAIAYGHRVPHFQPGVGGRNLEATYHVLLTVEALDASPAQSHRFLPIVSLGSGLDKHIPWGATLPTKSGDYIYTSFSSPGFLAPYIAFKSFGADPTIENLSRFNVGLGLVVSVWLYFLLVRMLAVAGYSEWVSIGGGLVGAAISVFSAEALHSHGLVYWSHSLYQLFLVAALWFISVCLDSDHPRFHPNPWHFGAIAVSVFLGATVEWTGYLFGAGLAVVLLKDARNDRRAVWLSVILLIALGTAFVLTFLQLAWVLGLEPAAASLVGRFLVRNAAVGTLQDLLNGYALSFGLFIAALGAALTANLFGIGKAAESPARQRNLALLFIIASIPLAENVILLQHASQFSFDRLKFIFPAALLLAIAFARFTAPWRALLALAVLLASIHGFRSYKQDLAKHRGWKRIHAAHSVLVEKISQTVDTNCAVLATNLKVRAYANLLMGRGIYEHKSKDETVKLMEQRGACAAIYLEGEPAFPDLPWYSSAIVIGRNGKQVTITPLP